MSTPPPASWHKRSYDRFLNERLPELIAARLPLEAYRAEATGPNACRVSLILANAAGTTRLEIDNVPAPDETGLFRVDGKKLVVLPSASCEEMDEAEIRCVGDYLYDFIEPRLGEAPPDLRWDESLARSWLPLDDWVREFLRPANVPWVTPLDDLNWLSRLEHLRRVVVDVPRGRQRVMVKGQPGRVCPMCTPEGPNIGRVLSVARGAEIRDGKIIIMDDSPVAKLSVSASMIPLIQHTDVNRALMGLNMMRQRIVLPDPEPALVQSGCEPDAPDFWCGRNLLTAYVSWGLGTFEDGIVISESCAERLRVDGLIEPGDKMSNRHGQKGVIGRILPDAEMPHLADGMPVELVCNFIGLQSRMNYGQIREAVLGRLARAEGEPIIAPPFGGPTSEEIRERLAKAGLPESGMEMLRMGKDGPALERPSTVGYVYWGVLDHLVRNKLHVVAGTGRSQRRGELDYWALRDIGAFENIIESFNTSSAERDGIETLPERLAAGEFEPAAPPAPMFKYLQRHLAAGGVRMEFDGERVAFALAEPTGEKLALACPVPHPWLRGRELTEVGAMPDLAEFQRLAEANEQVGRMLEGRAPETLVARSRDNLARAAAKFMEILLRPEGADLRGRVVVGGRVSFSGRSVIAPGLDLRIDQVGLPDEMAWTLFGPFVARELGDSEPVAERTARAAEKLDEIMARSWVIINRAPTMTPTCHLAFRPVRCPERVIRIHPLACVFMNADFDGDQVAVFLPVTPAAQSEAGETLSVAAHLRREADLIHCVVPPQDALWGLAKLSLTAAGREEIEAVAGMDLVGSEGFVSKGSLIDAGREMLRRDGEEKTLEILEGLMRLGFEAAKRSGASVNPFAGESLPEPAEPESMDIETCLTWLDEMNDALLARTDYESNDFGPQLLAVKSGARGNAGQLRNLLTGAVIADIDNRLFFTRRSFVAGHDAEEFFTWTVGSLRGLAQTALSCLDLGRERRRMCEPKGFSVLARAMRSRNAGVVLARAAANGEIDPLTDPDARLFVGLKPL